MIELDIWAAIDLRHGHVVSLRKGDPAHSFTWSDNPLVVANRWEREGATGLHIVDLDGAFFEGSNRSVIESILRNSRIPVQVGGGIRSVAQGKELLDLGTTRIILGTVAYDEPSILRSALRTLGGANIVVSLDYRDDTIVTKGWREKSSLHVLEAAQALESEGVETVLATAVECDGVACGPDFEMLRRLRDSARLNILASGGIRNIRDIRDLQMIEIDGVVIGRALYEGTIRMSQIPQKF